MQYFQGAVKFSVEQRINIKFRPELQFSLVKDAEEKVYTLYDPYNYRYFQFKEYEYGISQLLDGVNSAEDVCAKFDEQFDAILPKETLELFIRKLYDLGLIEGAPVPPKKDQYSGWLFKKFKLFNPDKLFNFLIDYVRVLFSPLAVKVFIVVLIIAGYVLLKRWNELNTYGIPGTSPDQWFGYIVIGIIVILIVSTHEFAHGLSLKYFGGRVPEIGFMLLLFMPAFYCDVSDAWRFPKKQRLFVTFAGGFYEVVLGAFALIVWSFAEPHLWLADIAYLIIVSSIFTIGINFNPLIRLDGYYLLSDFLEMPNLRSESVGYIVSSVAKMFVKLPEKRHSTKEKIVFICYGVLSTIFIIFMIYILYSLLAGWLIDNLRLTGVIISIVILISFLFSYMKGIIKGARQLNKVRKQKN